MINEIKKDAQERMQKSSSPGPQPGCNPYRPGAPKHPGSVMVPYYGATRREVARSPSKTPAP
jgi:uncharacterized membrane protein